MRKIFTVLGLAMLSYGASAQGIEIYLPGETDDVSGTTVELNAGDATMHQEFDVKNVSGDLLTLRITRLKVTELAGTLDYLCWGADALTGACYSAAVVAPNNPWTTPDATGLESDSIGWLSTYHQTEGNAGCAQYRYYVIDESDTKLDSVDVKYCSTVSIEEESKVDISVFPNPASTIVNVVLASDDSNVEIRLHNILGEVVYSNAITSGVNEISVADLPNGVYFYAILDSGNVIETKKLVVRH
jgi:hypothetical protein